jgi:hypothetical protein
MILIKDIKPGAIIYSSQGEKNYYLILNFEDRDEQKGIMVFDFKRGCKSFFGIRGVLEGNIGFQLFCEGI